MKYLLASLLLCGTTFAQIPSALIDGTSDSIVQIPHTHREIHDGQMWNFSEVDTLDTTEVAQVITLTPANVEVGDIFSVTIGGLTISFTATAATVANVTAGLDTNLATSLDTRFSDITWVNTGPGTLITGTADVAGRGFSATATATDGGGTDNQTLTLATTQVNVPDKLEYLITTTSAKSAHLLFDVTGTLVTTVTLYRDCTRTNGIAKTAYNHKGDSTATQTVTITAYPAGAGNGTSIFVDKWGISTGQGASTERGGGNTRVNNEWVIEKSGAYLLVVEGVTDADDVTAHLNWYEED